MSRGRHNFHCVASGFPRLGCDGKEQGDVEGMCWHRRKLAHPLRLRKEAYHFIVLKPMVSFSGSKKKCFSCSDSGG